HIGGLYVAHGNRTGALHLVVDVNRAGATLGDATAILGAGQPDMLPNDPKQRRVGLDRHISDPSVDIELSHALPPSFDRSITACRAFAYGYPPGAPTTTAARR